MEIAISIQGRDLNTTVDPRFGRARGFLFVDLDSLRSSYMSNPNISASGGAGIQTAQMVAQRGPEAVITGNIGPNAFRVLEAAGIRVITGVNGTAENAVERYKAGELVSSTSPTVGDHFGMGGRGPRGRDSGGGMGRGAGRGGGRW